MAQSSAAYSILQKHVPAFMLQGYLADVIDEEASKFYAITFVDIDPAAYEDNREIYDLNWGYTSTGFDPETVKIYIDEGKRYQHKNLEQCVREGIYKFFSMQFFGSLYDNRWYISKSIAYIGDKMSKDEAIDWLSRGMNDRSILNSSTYMPIGTHHPQWTTDKPPMSRGVEFLEFVGMPELVANIRQEEKHALLRAHAQFLYLDLFSAVLDKLRVSRFENYNEYLPFYTIESSFIFSKKRNFALLPLTIRNSKEECRLEYFFWHDNEQKIYLWHYFPLTIMHSSFDYFEEVINNLSKISYWNDPAFLHSSCTLDDEHFWQNYVLLKESGNYIYLTAIE